MPWLDHDHRAVVDLLRAALDAEQHRPGALNTSRARPAVQPARVVGDLDAAREACRQLSDHDALDTARCRSARDADLGATEQIV